MTRTAVPAVDGWFTTDGDEPALVGQRCTACRTYVFPRARVCCPNPPRRSTDFAVVGVGMHPWGKWGRNFVEYGVAAANDALDDAGVAWTDVQFVSGADTMRNGYPGYVSGGTFAQALGWTGARVASSYAACAS